MTAGELADAFDLPRPTMSGHFAEVFGVGEIGKTKRPVPRARESAHAI